MAAGSNFVSMDEVLQELQVSKPELDRMVTDGKLSPIRDAGTIKFRRTEVDLVKRDAETEATVMFDGPAGGDGEDESFDDGIFLVGDNKPDGADGEATIVGVPGSGQGGVFDDEETSKVDVSAEAGADEDSDQTSIIPPSSDGEEPQNPREEESIFDFGDEDIELESSGASEESSSGILAAESDSSAAVIEAAEDSSSDILDVNLADDESSSAISLAASVDDDSGTATVDEILELDESDDALASVQLDTGGDGESTAAEDGVNNSALDTMDGSDAGSVDLLAGDEGLETADTIDLTAADEDATATVEEVLDVDGEATEPGVLTAAEDTEPGVTFDDDLDAGSAEGPAMVGEYVVPDQFVFGPTPSHPIMTSMLVVSAVAMLLSGAFLVNSVIGVDSPMTQWATKLALDLFPK